MSKAKKQSRIEWSSLNVGERTTLLYMGKTPQAHLDEITASVFGDLGTGNSPARNAIRRLVSSEYLERVGKGTYSITLAGVREIPASLILEQLHNLRPSLPEPVEQAPVEVVEQPAQLELTDVERRAVELLRIALGLVEREHVYERRGDERRHDERRGIDRRLQHRSQNGVTQH